MNHWVTIAVLVLGPPSVFYVGSGGEPSTSEGHPEAEAHMTHALDPKLKEAHRQQVIPNIPNTLCRDSMIVQYLILEVA